MATDIDGDSLTYIMDSNPTLGNLTLNSDGSFSYTAGSTAGVDTFTYHVNDGTEISETKTVKIYVTGSGGSGANLSGISDQTIDEDSSATLTVTASGFADGAEIT